MLTSPKTKTFSSANSITLDCRGLPSPHPLVKLRSVLSQLAGRKLRVEVLADHWGFANDLDVWCLHNGLTILRTASTNGECYALLESQTEEGSAQATARSVLAPLRTGFSKEGQPTVNIKIPGAVRHVLNK